jgi:hypothetical protein
MAIAYLVLGQRSNPYVVQNLMTQDRTGAWFISNQPSDAAPRYRTGDGMLFWCESDANREAIRLFRSAIRRAEEKIAQLEARITTEGCEADNMPNSNTYPYIRAWHAKTGSRASYIRDQVELAQHEDAPERAVYRAAPGTWVTVDDLFSDENKQELEALVKQREY